MGAGHQKDQKAWGELSVLFQFFKEEKKYGC
jgi:hypothetical protein